MAVDNIARGMAANAKKTAENLTAFKNGGSLAFSQLPTPSQNLLNYVYTVTDSFITDSRFIEGAGKSYPAGTKVAVMVRNGAYYFDAYNPDDSAVTQEELEEALATERATSDNAYISKSAQTQKTDEMTEPVGIGEDGKLYGKGGATVSGNTGETPTETLEDLKIGNKVFGIPQGVEYVATLPEATEGSPAFVSANGKLYFKRVVEWDEPVVSGSTLTLTQANDASQSGATLNIY